MDVLTVINERSLHDLRCETCEYWEQLYICNTQKGRCKQLSDFSFNSEIRSAGIPWQVWETIRKLGCASHSNIDIIRRNKD